MRHRLCAIDDAPPCPSGHTRTGTRATPAPARRCPRPAVRRIDSTSAPEANHGTSRGMRQFGDAGPLPFARHRRGRLASCLPARGPLAQLAEQRTFNPKRAGSSPAGPTTQVRRSGHIRSPPGRSSKALRVALANAPPSQRQTPRSNWSESVGHLRTGQAALRGLGTLRLCPSSLITPEQRSGEPTALRRPATLRRKLSHPFVSHACWDAYKEVFHVRNHYPQHSGDPGLPPSGTPVRWGVPGGEGPTISSECMCPRSWTPSVISQAGAAR